MGKLLAKGFLVVLQPLLSPAKSRRLIAMAPGMAHFSFGFLRRDAFGDKSRSKGLKIEPVFRARQTTLLLQAIVQWIQSDRNLARDHADGTAGWVGLNYALGLRASNLC